MADVFGQGGAKRPQATLSGDPPGVTTLSGLHSVWTAAPLPPAFTDKTGGGCSERKACRHNFSQQQILWVQGDGKLGTCEGVLRQQTPLSPRLAPGAAAAPNRVRLPETPLFPAPSATPHHEKGMVLI